MNGFELIFRTCLQQAKDSMWRNDLQDGNLPSLSIFLAHFNVFMKQATFKLIITFLTIIPGCLVGTICRIDSKSFYCLFQLKSIFDCKHDNITIKM